MQDTWIRISDDTVFGYIIVPVCDTMVARQTAARERERERERESEREREGLPTRFTQINAHLSTEKGQSK